LSDSRQSGLQAQGLYCACLRYQLLELSAVFLRPNGTPTLTTCSLRGAICCSCHSFQFCDIEHVGVHIVVTTDDNPKLAASVAQEMGGWIWDHRQEFELVLEDASEAGAKAAPERQSSR